MSYIERESLIEKFHWVIRSDGTRVYVCHAEDIEAIPAADVAPVKHGQWLKTGTFGIHHMEIVICSACKKSCEGSINDDYCPNCGAKMDLGHIL